MMLKTQAIDMTQGLDLGESLGESPATTKEKNASNPKKLGLDMGMIKQKMAENFKMTLDQMNTKHNDDVTDLMKQNEKLVKSM